MAKFTKFTGYQGAAPLTILKPEMPPEPMIVTVQVAAPGGREMREFIHVEEPRRS